MMAPQFEHRQQLFLCRFEKSAETLRCVMSGMERIYPLKPNAVFLADDNKNDVLLLQRAFEDAAISDPLIIVRDGWDAVSYLSVEGGYADRNIFPWPGLLILDLNMPRLNGFEVLIWLQARNHPKGLPAVVLSSSHTESDIQRAMDLGADAYYVKQGGFHDLVSLPKIIEDAWLKPSILHE